MVVTKSVMKDSSFYVLALNRDEFTHLYMVICDSLSLYDSDKLLVEMESLMFNLL